MHVMNQINQLYRIIWQSRPLMQAAEATVECGLNGTGLTVRMRAILEILHRQGALTVPDLARELDIQRQYVQLMVNETCTAGLTEKQQNPRHKRSYEIILTHAGTELISSVLARETALVERLSDHFTEQDIATTLRVVCDLTLALKSQSSELG